jgi:pimeloyl-ACP methyl ester carboxylesterase
VDTAKRLGGMYVEESGTPGAPAILFLHGLGQSSREWRGHMAALGTFHCLAPDLPGHGHSNHLPLPPHNELIDNLAQLIETRVPAGRAHVVGISWGAFLVQALLQRHPERVERAVADGLPLIWPRGSWPLMLAFATLTTPFLHTRPVLALWRATHDPDDLRATSRRAWWRTWAVGLRDLTAATAASCPTLLVAGEKEGYVRPADAALATLMPHAEAWYAPGLNHCWQRAAPGLHIRTVEAWCSGQPLSSELRREPPPTPEMVERVRGMAPEKWYLRHRSRITWEIRIAFRHHRNILAGAYGKDEGLAITREAIQRFEALLPDIPYIGGDENPNTQTLYMTAYLLALYQSLRARGETVEGAARLLYQGSLRMMASFPFRLLLRWQGRRLFDRKVIEQRRGRALASQEHRYPDDWVFDFVEGDGHRFEHGLDYTECGVVKYLRREGAPELAPYLCWMDYPGYAAMGVRLTRTETIAQGGTRCDFRFSRGKPVEVEPEFLHG